MEQDDGWVETGARGGVDERVELGAVAGEQEGLEGRGVGPVGDWIRCDGRRSLGAEGKRRSEKEREGEQFGGEHSWDCSGGGSAAVLARKMGGMAFTEEFDVVVVGAGHAGCEAAMAAAGMGLRTALFTLNLDLIAQMSCNPAVGGIAKGHLVREVDALGGIMGEVADACGIQFRLLNTSRGPAVWSPRAQCDKALYRVKMREVLEGQKGLFIKQAEVVDLVVEEVRGLGFEVRGETHEPTHRDEAAMNGAPSVVTGVRLRDGRVIHAKATVVTTGTFLNGLIHCGEQQYAAGRSGEPASVLLGEALKRLGLRECRLKTGTPPRLDGRTIDWTKFEEQPGDADPTPFSFRFKVRGSRFEGKTEGNYGF